MKGITDEMRSIREETEGLGRKYRANENKHKEDSRKLLENWEEGRKDKIEKDKKADIEAVEAELRKTNGKVSEEALNERLGVSDWREKISQTSDILNSQRKRFEIEDSIRELKKQVICDYCGETKYPIIDYEIPSEKKKFCSLNCKSAWEKENKDKDKKDGDKKDSPAHRSGKFGDFDVNEFFGWMKRMGVSELKFDVDTNQVVIKLNSGKQLDIKESGLSTKQQENLIRQLKSTSQPISFSEVDRELNRKGKSDNKNGNIGIIVTVAVVGLILAIIIGVVIGKNKRKSY